MSVITTEQRRILKQFIDEKVHDPVLKQKLHDSAWDLTVSIADYVRCKYLPSDMIVLERYGLAKPLQRAFFDSPDCKNAAWREKFDVPEGYEKDANRPLVPTTDLIIRADAGDPLVAQYLAHKKLSHELAESNSKIRAAYNSLLAGTRSLDKLIGVWPEAETILQQKCVPAPPEMQEALDVIAQNLSVRTTN